MPDPLELYKSKRDFAITSEPAEGGEASRGALTFVIQKHWATRLHYDFRLELDGAMKSWAVPKGPSYDTRDKRMAIHVEDHPISYSDFEGTIPPHQYGAGKVIVWDKGTWTPLGDPRAGLEKGELKFEIHGHKMHGRWVLVRMRSRGERQEAWLLIKEKDDTVRPADEFSVVDAMPDSVRDLPMPAGPGEPAVQAKVDALEVQEARSDGKPARTRARKGEGAAAEATPGAALAAKVASKSSATGTTTVAGEAASKSSGKSSAKRTAKVATSAANSAATEVSTKSPAESAAKATDPAGAPAAARPAARKRTRSALPDGAVAADLPETLSPELATLVDGPPTDPADWLYEIKFDGYRMLARIEGKDIRLVTRNGNDWTAKLGPLKKEIARLKLPDGWYDGEIVVHDENGKPNFNLLQQAFDGANGAQVVYFVFDVPYHAGHDLRAVRLDARRPLLQALLEKRSSETVRFSGEFGADPAELVAAACRIGLEGVIGKRRDSRYVTRRSPDWIKLKCGLRQEFVIGGFTDPQGSRAGIGALLLGYHDADGVLRFAGHVGSGFDGASLRHLRAVLEPIEAEASPFPPRAVPGRGSHWVAPTRVAEVSFSEWTPAGVIRHGVFQGLRQDKPARGVVRERAAHVPEAGAGKSSTKAEPAVKSVTEPAARRASKKTPVKAAAEAGGIVDVLPSTFKVTHGDRVMDAESGATKLDLVRYYALVGELMMSHLKARPVSLVRAPEGVGGELFFQKHVGDPAKMPGVALADAALDPEHPPMTEIATREGLLSCAQWNVVEIHSQNATDRRYDTPDRMVFDLDPGEGVDWQHVRDAARLVRAFLEALGLVPFLKTSGGKGLHVVVPLEPKLDWDTVKDFSHAVVDHLAGTIPDRFSAKAGPKNRVGRVFIDYLRNGRGATTVAAWSARTRPGLGISVPVRWDELDALTSGAHWTVETVQDRLGEGNDPWAGYDKSAKTLTRAMKTLGFKPAKKN